MMYILAVHIDTTLTASIIKYKIESIGILNVLFNRVFLWIPKIVVYKNHLNKIL